MSATRDKTQKFTFLYSNLYQIYSQAKAQPTQQAQPVEQAQPVQQPKPATTSGHVLKTEDLNKGALAAVRVEKYNPPEFIGKRVARPDILPPAHNAAVESLKENLQKLNDLHARLRFMLQELEDLVKS